MSPAVLIWGGVSACPLAYLPIANMLAPICRHGADVGTEKKSLTFERGQRREKRGIEGRRTEMGEEREGIPGLILSCTPGPCPVSCSQWLPTLELNILEQMTPTPLNLHVPKCDWRL